MTLIKEDIFRVFNLTLFLSIMHDRYSSVLPNIMCSVSNILSSASEPLILEETKLMNTRLSFLDYSLLCFPSFQFLLPVFIASQVSVNYFRV